MFSAFSDKNNPKKSERYSNNAGEQIKKTEIEKSGIHARNVTGMHEPGDSSFKKNFSQIFETKENVDVVEEKNMENFEKTDKNKISLVKKELDTKSFVPKNLGSRSFWRRIFLKKTASKPDNNRDVLSPPKQEIDLSDDVVKNPGEDAGFEVEKIKQNHSDKVVDTDEEYREKSIREEAAEKEEQVVKKEQETKDEQVPEIEPSVKTYSKQVTNAPIHRTNKYDVDLLTKEYIGEFEQINPYAFLGVCSALSLVSGIILLLGSFAYEMRVKISIEREKNLNIALGETIKTYGELEKEDGILSKKVEALSLLLKNHISWKDFLEKLEKETIPEVSYVDMAASTSGSVSISAVAKDYTSLARQMTVFQKVEWIKKLDITGASYSKDTDSADQGVSFDMTITVDKQIFPMKK